jgi:hypothetical protein
VRRRRAVDDLQSRDSTRSDPGLPCNGARGSVGWFCLIWCIRVMVSSGRDSRGLNVVSGDGALPDGGVTIDAVRRLKEDCYAASILSIQLRLRRRSGASSLTLTGRRGRFRSTGTEAGTLRQCPLLRNPVGAIAGVQPGRPVQGWQRCAVPRNSLTSPSRTYLANDRSSPPL